MSLAVSCLILGVGGEAERDGYTATTEESGHLIFTNCAITVKLITLPSSLSLPSSQDVEAKMEELEAALVKQLQTDTAVEKLEEQRKMFMSKLEELETTLSQKHHEVRQAAASRQTDEYRRPGTVYSLSVSRLPSSLPSRLSEYSVQAVLSD